MKSEFISEHKNKNLSPQKYYYYLNFNENLSSFFSKVIQLYQKEKNKMIILNSIFFDEENLELIFISYSKNSYYLVNMPVNNSQENKLKEIEIKVMNSYFKFGSIKFSEDKRHLVIFNEEKNKLFILYNYIQKLNLNNQVILENYYENAENKKILDIKFSDSSHSENLNNDYIMNGIYCKNESLSIFNNKYLNKEFAIKFNEAFLDFQFVNNINGGCDLYIMHSYGNFKFIKNINNIENIPKNDKSEMFQKIKIFDKVIHNINICEQLYKNELIKFYAQPQIDIKEKMENQTNIITVLRVKKNILEIGALTNNKLFLIKKYYLEEEKNDIKQEHINEIIPMKNQLNKFIIQSNKNIYFLDIPSLINLSLVVKNNNIDNEEKIKHEILFSLNEIIQNISFNKILKYSLQENNNNLSLIYNFFRGSIFCLKNCNNNLLARIYDFELDNPIEYDNLNSNYIINKKELNQKKNEQTLLMENLLKNIKIEIECFNQIDLNNINKNEYYNKILNEFSINEVKLRDLSNSKNINNNIKLINDCYYNLYNLVQLLGQKIQFDDEENLQYNLDKRINLYNKLEKIDEKMNDKKASIQKKLKIIEENRNKIMELKNENNKYLYEHYLKNSNFNNEGKDFSNQLLKRINNQVVKNKEFIQNEINQDDNFIKLNFEQFQAFPLTLKYLNDFQDKDLNHLLVLIKKLFLLLNKFCEQLKNKQK